MLVGVISDTHDRLENIDKAINVFKEKNVEMIVHCGDWVSPFALKYFDETCEDWRVPVKSVFGNNEGDVKYLLSFNERLLNPVEFGDYQALEFEADGRKAVIYHGHDEVLLKSLIDSQKYDVVFTGHTHEVRNKMVSKTLVLNPGSASYAFDNDASVAVYDSGKNEAEIISL